MSNKHSFDISENADRVQRNTASDVNLKVEVKSRRRVEGYNVLGNEYIDEHLQRLDREWDIERALETGAAALTFTGTVLGATSDRRWLALPLVVSAFLMQHALQGWCPPLVLFRRLGLRTRREIDKEKFALKAMRGDFVGVTNNPRRSWDAAV